jgi:tetratricopeptide (TPR) repeat protein
MIVEVSKPAPQELAAAQAAFQQRDFDTALRLSRQVGEGFAGLQVDWVPRAMALTGQVLLAKGELVTAEATFQRIAQLYPASSSSAVKLGRAQIAAAKGDFATAKAIAEPLVADALTKEQVSKDESALYGAAFFVLGRVEEGQGNFQKALEHYLRTVTIFYHDPTLTTSAIARAEALRRDKNVTVP